MALNVWKPIIVAASVTCLSGCGRVDADVARRVLAADGYMNIVVADCPGFVGMFLSGCDKYYQLVTAVRGDIIWSPRYRDCVFKQRVREGATSAAHRMKIFG